MSGLSDRPMRSFVAALAATCLVSCTGKLDVSLPGPVTEGQIEPVTVAASLAKVKGLLTGLPPTDAEVQAVQADPKALRGLVEQWTATPQHTAKMLPAYHSANVSTHVWHGRDQVIAQALGRVPLSCG